MGRGERGLEERERGGVCGERGEGWKRGREEVCVGRGERGLEERERGGVCVWGGEGVEREGECDGHGEYPVQDNESLHSVAKFQRMTLLSAFYLFFLGICVYALLHTYFTVYDQLAIEFCKTEDCELCL